MLQWIDPPLYPDEAEIAQRVLGRRAREWPSKAIILEREGLPKIDPLMGDRDLRIVYRDQTVPANCKRNMPR